MKPANLLLNSECLMKVADFGLARKLGPKGESVPENEVANMTDYVATRWYRAPEILVGSNKYGAGVDYWSLGCIFGEMLGGRPVFCGNVSIRTHARAAVACTCVYTDPCLTRAFSLSLSSLSVCASLFSAVDDGSD